MSATPEEIAFILSLRGWSAQQRSTLVEFARTRADDGLSDEDLSVLLAGASGLGGSTSRSQRPALSLLARAIGVERLKAAIKLEGDVRLGAAWLLIEEGSATALRAVADRAEDKDDDVRTAAALATSLLRPASGETPVRSG